MPAPQDWRPDRDIASDPPDVAQPGNISGSLLLENEHADFTIIPMM
jgi:hypothetical protein